MKLRTEFINLNHYLHNINYHSDGMCDHCNTPETVAHFLIDCEGYRLILSQFFHKFKNIVKFYKEFILGIIKPIKLKISPFCHFCH